MKQKSVIYNNCRFVQFPTSDGLTLPGLFFNSSNTKKAAIFLHGNGSSSVFYYDNYFLAERLREKGINLLMFNNRGAYLFKKLNIDKGNEASRKMYGMAHESIKECIFDIESALDFLEEQGYSEFYLMGASSGANKVVVYNYYMPENRVSKYILISGGDDLGVHYNILGKEKFMKLLVESRQKKEEGNGKELILELIPNEYLTYSSYYDMLDPDGDYNIFPFYEELQGMKLAKDPFRYFNKISKSTLVVYGEKDAYVHGSGEVAVEILKKHQPQFTYEIIKNGDHNFGDDMDKVGEIIADWI